MKYSGKQDNTTHLNKKWKIMIDKTRSMILEVVVQNIERTSG